MSYVIANRLALKFQIEEKLICDYTRLSFPLSLPTPFTIGAAPLSGKQQFKG